MEPREPLEGLDEQQRRAATAFGVPLAVLAPAGSGKTRTIVARLAHGIGQGDIDPQNCLALTFTTRAAGELRSRLGAMGCPPVAARTIHAAALRQLRFFWPQIEAAPLARLAADRVPLVAQAREQLRLSTDLESVVQTATQIGWAKSHLYAPERFAEAFVAAMRTPPRGGDAEELARVYAMYEELKTKADQIDFDDVLTLLIGILDEQPEIASQIRRTYRHLTIDEFQDTSPLQYELIRQWVGPRRDICVVGDPDQSIYGFAGADAHYLRNFADLFPNAEVVTLENTYRCAPRIVAAARGLGLGSGVTSVHTDASGDYQEIPTDSEAAELQAVCERVQSLLASGIPAAHIAVLSRQQDRAREIVDALRDAGLPVALRGMTDFFQRQEVKLALLELRAGETQSVLEAVTKVVSEAGWSPDQSRASNIDQWDSYAVLVGLATMMTEQDSGARVEDFLAEVYQRAEALELPAAPAVSVLTMHAAKGLEWDAVIVTGLIEGVMPHVHAHTVHALAEERRLLYVAMTRAKTSLTITWPQTRGDRPTQRSSFLGHTTASESVNPGT